MPNVLDDAIARARARKSLPAPSARRLLREQAGLSQQDVADAIGVTPAAVSYWETGTREPRAAHLPRYLEILQRCAREGLA
jgi:DNA-binding transcriptional regulator YiaG